MLDTSNSIRRNLFTAVFLTAIVGGTAVAWSVYTPLDGAVVATGTVIVEDNVKKVQHPTGGVVGEITVREGDRVESRALLVRLDATTTAANLAIVMNDLRANRARMARLEAQRDGYKEPVFPIDLRAAATTDSAAASVLDGETKLCRFRMKTREEQKQQLRERISQLREEVHGLEEQQKSVTGQLRIANQELEDLRPLQERGNVQRPRISGLEREVLRNQGFLGDTLAKIAQSQGKIAETELQIVQNDNDFISDVIKELRETETKITELQERRITAEDQLRRLEIRAPISGTVHQLSVHTIGGVISPSETLMLLVPDTDRLIVEVRITPQDIDQLIIGEATRVRFSAFNRRTTDEVEGTLIRIAADLTHDPQTNQSYYTAAVRVSASELAKLKGLRLVPGMPAEVFIKTGERTFASYLMKPLQDQMQRAFRER